jgi:hypothetical protein
MNSLRVSPEWPDLFRASVFANTNSRARDQSPGNNRQLADAIWTRSTQPCDADRMRVLLLSLLVACGGGRGGGSPTTLAADLAEGDCAFFFRCCDDAELADLQQLGFSDEAGCRVVIHDLFQEAIDDLQFRVDAGELRFDGSTARECTAMLDAETCPLRVTSNACASIYVGLLPDGAACTRIDTNVSFLHNSNACASGVCDAGTCVPARQVNEACVGEDCARGLTCVLNDTSGVCREPLADGEPCSVSAECASGTCNNGTCGDQTFCDGR